MEDVMKEAIKIKIIILLGILTAMLLSCSVPKEKQENAAQDHLAQLQKSRDSIEGVMMVSLDEIDRRIGIIASQKGYLYFNSRSDVKDKKEQILSNIAMMDELISDNEKRITKLRTELKRIYSVNKGLDKRIAKYENLNISLALEIKDYKKMLAAEEERNNQLTSENEKLNIEAISQTVTYDNLKTEFNKAEKDAYTAYYVNGTRKELKKAEVIEKKNLLGIGADKLNSNVSPEKFEKIDTRTTLEIPVNAKDAKIVTAHNTGSYKWQDEGDGTKLLCITDPEAFWQKSKYLVIEVK